MTTLTGTSVAAAHVAGAVANLFSWGIVEGHNLSMSAASIKAFLIRGGQNEIQRYRIPTENGDTGLWIYMKHFYG